MNKERLQYLPPVDSLIYSNNSYFYKESFEILDKIEDITLENSFSVSNNQLATSSSFWNYNASNKGPKKRYNIEFDENSFDPLSLVYEDPIKEMKLSSGKLVKKRNSDVNCTKPNLPNFIKIRNNIVKSTQSYKQLIHKHGRISPKHRNILASKICRLKKKAFHESLKIKYSALGIEYAEIIELLDWINYYKKMLFPLSKKSISKKIDEIHLIRAAGRLDDFIMDLVSAMDVGDLENSQINKLRTFNPEDDRIRKFEYSFNEEIDDSHELNFLIEEGFINDFLNSSGSTSFSDDFIY